MRGCHHMGFISFNYNLHCNCRHILKTRLRVEWLRFGLVQSATILCRSRFTHVFTYYILPRYCSFICPYHPTYCVNVFFLRSYPSQIDLIRQWNSYYLYSKPNQMFRSLFKVRSQSCTSWKSSKCCVNYFRE